MCRATVSALGLTITPGTIWGPFSGVGVGPY